MGLLDFISGSYSGGGLLGNLYPSPLLQPQDQPQTQYDQMGNPIFTPQSDGPGPFGPPPGLDQWAAQFAPKPGAGNFNAFSQGAQAAPFAPQTFAAGPTIAPPQAAPQPQPAPQGVDFPQNQISVGGYQMPRVGDASNFVPQTPTDVSAQSRQPQMAQAQMQPEGLPPALGGIGSALGRAFNPDGLIARLTGNDSRSIAQQNLKAQYDALVPIVGPQKAMLAVLNPEAGKTILAQALEKKNYGFIKTDGDQIVRTDPQKGTAEAVYGGGNRSDEVAGPDGKPIKIPPGLDPSARKVFVDEISRANAKAQAGEKTEVQAKAEIFANKMELSNKQIQDGVGTSLAGKIASGVPLGNYVQSPEYQKYKQASSNFITALLRQESGAAISKTEFDRYDKEYMPQPGDSPEVLAQKSELRRVAIESMKKGAGPGYKSPSSPSLPAGWSVTVR